MNKPNLVIIGAGGVGAVAAQKAAQFHDEFGRIVLASRTLARAETIAADANRRWNKTDSRPRIETRKLNARDPAETAALLTDVQADLVMNMASPYCNNTIMDACIEAGAHYMDTAVHENEAEEHVAPPWYANHEWPRRPAFAAKKLNALLGIGFDPGVVNIFCAYVKKHYLDEIDSIDIYDVNAGNHHRYFATNFDAETNLREIMEDVYYWENGEFKRIPHHSQQMEVTLPEVGTHTVYAMGHDELHSLPVHFPEARRIKFWMGFSEHYLQVFNVLNGLGLTSSMPVDIDGVQIPPVRMVKAVLPDPASLAEAYTGKCCIGNDIRGRKDGKQKRYFIWSVCEHQACYAEVGSQAIAYTAAVPTVAAARLLAKGVWNPQTMVNMEELDPDPFLSMMADMGIDWAIGELPVDGGWSLQRMS